MLSIPLTDISGRPMNHSSYVENLIASSSSTTPSDMHLTDFSKEPADLPTISLRESLASLTYISPSRSTFSSRPTTAGSLFSSRHSSTTCRTSISSLSNDLEHVPKLTQTPWELDRSQRTGTRPFSAGKPFPERFFQQLPEEVYQCLLNQLEQTHFCNRMGTCTLCYMKDLYNLALTSRAFERPARRKLFSKIWISSVESTSLNRSRSLPEHRIKFLRRTLRQTPWLGLLVKELHFPDAQEVYQTASTKERQNIINDLASLVMACPRLQRFTGLYLTYDHGFDRLTHAISTRSCLKEKLWVIKAADEEWDDSDAQRTRTGMYEPPWNLERADSFLHSHDNWACLETLLLFGQGDCSMMDYRAFVATFRNLPSLKRLLISDFGRDQFNDRTLQALPALRSLRLQDLPGLTDRGLMRFANSENAKFIQSLSLLNIEIASATVISRYFKNLTTLRRFLLTQQACPTLALGLELSRALYASASVEYIHWEIMEYGSAHSDLASSIQAGAFPSLRKIRAPNDDDGLLQALCRPRAEIALPSDDHTSQKIENPFSFSCLSTARRHAQQRLEDARRVPFMKILVDEAGQVLHSYTLWNFMGTLGSKIEYCLEADVEGSEEPMAGLNDFLIRRVVKGGSAENICSANMSTVAKRELGRKKHMQRRMLKSPSLDIFF